MIEKHVLRPLDVPVAAYLVLFSGASYSNMAYDLDISPSTAFQSTKRLVYSGLARQVDGERRVNVAALLEFLEHGVRYAFPAKRDRPKRGVPTAHAAPALQGDLDSDVDPVVWPAARGSLVGASIEPLIPSAPELLVRCPPVYDLLTIIDAIRIGNARDREAANQVMRMRFEGTVMESSRKFLAGHG